jgi:hypothetical protein
MHSAIQILIWENSSNVHYTNKYKMHLSIENTFICNVASQIYHVKQLDWMCYNTFKNENLLYDQLIYLVHCTVWINLWVLSGSESWVWIWVAIYRPS